METLRTRQRWLLALGASALLAVAAASAVFALTVEDFEYNDGNTVRNNPGLADWNDLTSGSGDAVAITAGRYGAIIDDNNYLTERTLFTGGGSKDVNDVSQWAWRAVGQPPDKTDLLNAAAALYEDPGANDVYFMADRYATNGDAKIGFWFFQNPVVVVPDPTSNTFGTFQDGMGHPASHANGDILVEATFTNGGKVPAINVYKWTSMGLELQGDIDGYDCKEVNLSTYEVCGTVNTGPYVPAWPYGGKFTNRPDGSFFEGALDLEALFGDEIPCFSSFLAETRSAASSVNSELKDFVLGSFDTCGSLTIRKEVAGDDSSFTFTSDTLDAPFDLMDGEEQAFTDLVPGTYDVSETVTAGYTLYDVTCDTNVADWDWSGTELTVDVAAGDDITCTFYNGQRPTLEVEKIVDPADDPGRFNLLLGTETLVYDASSGDGYGPLTLTSGDTYVVSETAGTSTDLADYMSSISCTGFFDGGTESTGATSISITLSWGDKVYCEILNERIPEAFTRTQGYWSTHPDMVLNTWNGTYGSGSLLTNFGCTPPGTPSVSTTEHQDQVLGGFWAQVSYTDGGDRRSNLNKAKMTLLQQLLAAILNVRYFGAYGTIEADIATAKVAFCASGAGAQGLVNTSAGVMGAYNESGDYGGVIAQNTNAEPGVARERANTAFWDYLGKN